MPLIQLVITLIIVGVLLGLLHYIAPMIHLDGRILTIIDVVVLLCVVLWLLSVFGVFNLGSTVTVPRAR